MENTTKVMIDDAILDSMLEKSQYSQNNGDDFWFSRINQKRYIFMLGAKFMELEEMSPDEAISLAQDYVDTFYNKVMNPDSWKR